MEVLDIYWFLLWGSLVVAILSLFLGDLFEGLFEGLGEVFNPLLLFGTLAVISGSGVLLTKYAGISHIYVLIISLIIGLLAYFVIYYLLVIPLSNAESSTSISVQDLVGKTGEVITTIPADGYGEVFITSTNGSRSETARSFDHIELKQGRKIVVVEVKEQILYVAELTDDL